MSRLDGKVAVVTGGALGIGRATCKLFANEGAKVAVTDILDDEGKAFAGEIGAKYYHMDVSDESEVKSVINLIAEEFGAINVLVNNAGISGTNKPPHEITEEEWDHVMAVNVKGTFFPTKHAVPHMKKAGGGSGLPPGK